MIDQNQDAFAKFTKLNLVYVEVFNDEYQLESILLFFKKYLTV